MADDIEYRIGSTGQVFEAAPVSAKGPLEPKVAPGSTPRNWETRVFGECAAIVAQEGVGSGSARHYACCQPIHDPGKDYGKYPYCKFHWPFQKPRTSPKDFVRGLRRYIT